MYFGEKNLAATMAFFDVNRAAPGIRDLVVLPTVKQCPTGFQTLKKLYKWPGTSAGYIDATDKVVKGVSTTGTQIAKRDAVDLNIWKGSHFCAAYVQATDFVRKDKVGTCATNQLTCGDCSCFKGVL